MNYKILDQLKYLLCQIDSIDKLQSKLEQEYSEQSAVLNGRFVMYNNIAYRICDIGKFGQLVLDDKGKKFVVSIDDIKLIEEGLFYDSTGVEIRVGNRIEINGYKGFVTFDSDGELYALGAELSCKIRNVSRDVYIKCY